MGGTDFHTKAVADDLIGKCNNSGCLGSHSHQMKVLTERTEKGRSLEAPIRNALIIMPSMLAIMLPTSLIVPERR